MGMGGISGYAATNARVRSMYSTLLSPQDYARLLEAPDFDTLITLLKRSPYGPSLEDVKDRDLSPRRAAFQLRARLAEAYTNLIYTTPFQSRRLLVQLYRNFEVDNLKAVLRGIVAGASWDQVRFLLFPLGPVTVLPAQAMMETRNVTTAIELLRGTPYEEPLSFALKRFSAEQNLFPLEVALDLSYWRNLWNDSIQLAGQDRMQALRILGPLIDVTNLMWAIRYRVYHHLSEEEMINYTLPFGYHVHDQDIRAIAAGADIARIVERIYPEISGVDELLADTRSGLSILEMKLQREIVKGCQAVLLGNPFHIGVPIAYLLLHKMEIQDLTVLIEAKSTQARPEDFRPYLLMEPALNKA